uniref:MD-2-related lipid-recognition domain-containing protein n=1 Tax=Sinocyclocheilus rhinocerous TaxID=307959 RepID=A0A673LGI2_9TELE
MKIRLRGNMLLVLILIMVQMNWVHSQDPQWPVHTVCDSERLTVTYRSCGQSIDELYSSYELWLHGQKMPILNQDEPLCLPHFPRFKFCGSRRGEIITVESSFKSKTNIPLKVNFDLKLRAINQDGFLIACVNATLSFH